MTDKISSEDFIKAFGGVKHNLKRPQGDLISRSELKKCAIWTKVNNGVELIDIEVVPLDAIDNAQTVPQIAVFTENADEEAIEDLKTELQSVINSKNPREGMDFKDYLAEKLKDPEFKKEWENVLKEEKNNEKDSNII